MKTIGIIAEFNPFHKGHEYFISEARRLSGADYVVVIMSGDFVQRGECAIWDKYIRAKAALLGGADLVLELPCAFATLSAAYFASGAVSLLNKLGVIDELWFGSEADDDSLFDSISDILADEPVSYQNTLHENLKTGMTFPAARAAAICGELDAYDISADKKSVSEFLGSPNNILGLEYVTAIKKGGCALKPRTIKRLGEDYNSVRLSEKNEARTGVHYESSPSFASALAIRKAIGEGRLSDALLELPGFCTDDFDMNQLMNRALFADDFSLILKYALMRESVESLCEYHDIDTDLARRIKNLENECQSFTQFAALLKTKNQTYTRVSRSLMRIILSIHSVDVYSAMNTKFIRVLGINKNANPLFSAIKKSSAVSLCAKPSELKNDLYKRDLFASNLYESVYCSKYNTDFRHEFTRQICLRAQ